jgi:aminomethyltransferase
MHKSLRNIRFSIKPQIQERNRPVELARTMSIHPLTYQELPYDPEYSQYAGRLTTEKLSNATPDEQYWKTKQEIILRHTGEHPYEISGPDALNYYKKFFQEIFQKLKKEDVLINLLVIMMVE